MSMHHRCHFDFLHVLNGPTYVLWYIAIPMQFPQVTVHRYSKNI